jgi:hypothetical protein
VRIGVGHFSDWHEHRGQKVYNDPATVLFTVGSSQVTLGTVATIASIGGTVMSAMGASQQGQANAQAAEYNAAMARNEAQAEEARRRRESQRQMGAIRANIGKSGVTSAGTPLMVLGESAEMAELDALTARWQGQTQSDLYSAQARSARKAIPYNVGASLLSGAGSIIGRTA